MTENAKTELDPKTTALAQAPGGGLANPYDYGDDIGAGVNEMGNEQRVPILLLLQDNSPQLKQSNAKYVEGAKSGMLFNPTSGALYPAQPGILFVPVIFQRMCVDYRPRELGGGFLAKHPWSKELMKEGKQKGNRIGTHVLQGGQVERVDTRYLAGFRVEDEKECNPVEVVVLAFSSTKMKPFQVWSNRVLQVKGPPPLGANVVRVSAVSEKNRANQEYWNMVLQPARGNDVVKSLNAPDHPIVVAGKKLREQVEQGLVNIMFETGDDDEGAPAEGAAAGAGGGAKPPF